MTPESIILRGCLDYLAYHGIFHWRHNAAPIPLRNGGFRRFNGKRGMPDILCLWNGKLIGVEVKSEKGRLGEDQLKTHDELMANGAVVVTVRSVDELDTDLRTLRVVA